MRRQAADRLCATARLVSSSRLRTRHTGQEERRREVEDVLAGNRVTYGVKMTMSVPERKSGSEGKEEESEDESEILEESPCGRWQKRKEQVSRCVCVYVRECVFVLNQLCDRAIHQLSCPPCVMQYLNQTDLAVIA